MTELKSDYISDYYTIFTSYVFINVDTTNSFRGIIKIKPFKIFLKNLNIETYFQYLGKDWFEPDGLYNS